MIAVEIVEALIRENPKLHWVSEQDAQEYNLPPGLRSWAVGPQVLRYLSSSVQPNYRTLETGAGHTTVALSALGSHHTCIAIDKKGVELIQQFMQKVGIPAEHVSFMVESSDTALPRLVNSDMEPIDFAFIDGCHGYPFPALDWHFIDLKLKAGGVVGIDDTQIRSVANLCSFLEDNESYSFVCQIGNTSFYEKLKDQNREWVFQEYNYKGQRAGLRDWARRFLQLRRFRSPLQRRMNYWRKTRP